MDVNAAKESTSYDCCTEKQGLEVGKKRKRSKRAQPENWASNTRKKSRQLGLAYVRTTGGIREERKPRNLGQPCSCSNECHKFITDHFKTLLCKAFWSIGNIERQRDFIVSHVVRENIVRARTDNSRRKYTQKYILEIDGSKYLVCKVFFLKTLDVSEKFVRTALDKSARSVSGITSPDRRGRHSPGIKRQESDIRFALEHIDSFPREVRRKEVGAAGSKETSSVMSREKMYGMYKSACEERKMKAVSLSLYKDLLNKRNAASSRTPKSVTKHK